MAHELKSLSQRHHAMVMDCISGLGRTEIAKKYGMTPEGVGGILKSPVFQDEVAREREKSRGEVRGLTTKDAAEVRGKILEAGDRAADVMVSLMSAPSPEMQYKSSQYILDRVLGKEVSSGPVGGMITLSAEHMNILVLAMKESSGTDLVEQAK
jgi:hypothetical protein